MIAPYILVSIAVWGAIMLTDFVFGGVKGSIGMETFFWGLIIGPSLLAFTTVLLFTFPKAKVDQAISPGILTGMALSLSTYVLAYGNREIPPLILLAVPILLGVALLELFNLSRRGNRWI